MYCTAISNSTRIILSFIFVIAFTASALAQIVGQGTDTGLGGTNTIGGYVIGPEGQRVERRIQVRLETPTRGSRNGMTDEKGNFLFTRLPAGNYTLVIDKEKEFAPITYSVDIIQLRGSPPQNYHLSLKLASRPKRDTKPGVLNVAFADVPKEALDHFSKAQELALAKDPKGSILELEQAIKLHPTFMLAYNEMGIEYLRLNELARAEASFKEALKIQPEAFQPLMNLGIILVQTKRFDHAEPILRSALKAEGSAPVAHYFLGQALANLGKFDEAEKELTTALKDGGPEVKEAHRTLAIIYGSRGDRKRQVSELETYLKLAPNVSDAAQLRQLLKQLKSP